MDDGGAARRAQLVARIRDALARGEGELGLDVTVEESVVTLRGVVQSQERLQRIEELSRLVSPDSVRNEITVRPPESPAPMELPSRRRRRRPPRRSGRARSGATR
jgi:osmotically-inducible protein OsmY